MHICSCGLSVDTEFKLSLHRDRCNAWKEGGSPDPDGEQTCKRCVVRKPLSDYHLHPNRKNGRDGTCRTCRSSSSKEYRESHSDTLRASQVEYYASHRADLVRDASARYYANRDEILAKKASNRPDRKSYLRSYRESRRDSLSGRGKSRRDAVVARVVKILGGRCASCGEDEPELLTVDHVHQDGHIERASRGGIGWKRDILFGVSDKSKYRVLCHSCNLGDFRLNPRSLRSRKTDVGTLKECPTCALVKDESEFHSWKGGRPYYECGVCKAFRNLTYTLSAQSVLGGVCVCCSESAPHKLAMDHVHDDGFRSRSSDKTGSAVARKLVRDEPGFRSRFQLLCHNCNYSKHAGRGLCVHQRPRAAEPPPPAPPVTVRFSMDDVRVSRGAPGYREFLDEHHYAGFGRSASCVYTAHFGDVLVGCAKFSTPVRQEVSSSLGYMFDRVLELDRFCIHPSYHKKNFASWFLSKAVEMLALDRPLILALVSFADPRFGHDGTLYSASNWKLVSDGSPGYTYVDESGKDVHKKTVWDAAKTSRVTEKDMAGRMRLRKVKTPPKRKYVYVVQDPVSAARKSRTR